MRKAAAVRVRSRLSQVSLDASPSDQAPAGRVPTGNVPWTPPFNALKHGLRSGSTLLPGDNAAAFLTLRRRLFHLYQPRTLEEALCVETVAACHWRIARCRLEYAGFKHHLGAALSGHPATTGTLCAADPHRLYHRGTDCVLEEGRLERQKSRAQATLRLLQQQRTQNLTVGGAAALEDYTALMAEGEPDLPDLASPTQAPAAQSEPTTPGNDGESCEISKRAARPTRQPPVAPNPSPANRRARRLALRRAARSLRSGARTPC